MKQTVKLMAAPPGMQPGGYVPVAYADRYQPATSEAQVETLREADAWRIVLRWACATPVKDIARETDKFLDACALLVPTVPDAPWMTMGAPGMAVEGVLWRPDKEVPWKLRAEGLGTMERSAVPTGWKASGEWRQGHWLVTFEIPAWPALDRHGQLAFALWQGAAQERAGLKSVSPGWIDVG